MSTILVIDDNPAVGTALEVLFSLHDIATLQARTPEDGLSLLDTEQVDLVVQDMNFTRDTTSGEEGEALFGAIYLDAGFFAAQGVIEKFLVRRCLFNILHRAHDREVIAVTECGIQGNIVLGYAAEVGNLIMVHIEFFCNLTRGRFASKFVLQTQMYLFNFKDICRTV